MKPIIMLTDGRSCYEIHSIVLDSLQQGPCETIEIVNIQASFLIVCLITDEPRVKVTSYGRNAGN
jgi:hypothetical protein